jgi:all-trans-retinol 13,14-reductase
MPFEMVKKWEHTQQGNRGPEYLEFKDQCTAALLDLTEQRFPELRSAILYREASTPLTWRDYTGIPEGSMYGIERDYQDPLVTTLLPATKIPGFYFTGQNINLHGVLGVTIGAILTCGEILGMEYLLNKIRNT